VSLLLKSFPIRQPGAI